MKDDIAIKISHISKTFKVPHEKHSSLKSAAVDVFSIKKFTKFKALEDIDFEIKKGEFFGIVGKNGSGKSTLLKILANIYQPNGGKVKINGTLAPFIELGVGFNPELTGRENVYLSGTILGMKRKKIEDIYDDIVAFAEIGDFMDQKLKNYSSGMQVRLAFSIAVQAQSDIMLIDEVLAVGDSAFQAKCINYFYKLKASGKTIVFVSHDMSTVAEFCDRVLVIDSSKALAVCEPREATRIYEDLNIKKSTKEIKESMESGRWGSGEVLIKKVTSYNAQKEQTSILQTGEPFKIVISTTIKDSSYKAGIRASIGFNTADGMHLAAPDSGKGPFRAGDTIEFSMKKMPLLEGSYMLTIALVDIATNKPLDFLDSYYSIKVLTTEKKTGKFEFAGDWKKGD
jgi:ABC-2 type transport system ATP-binding protein